MDEREKSETIARVTDRVAARYPAAPRSLVARVVAEEYESLEDSRVRTYIPTLVEHGARNKLHREFSARTPEP